MPLALVVPLVACRDGPTAPPSDAAFARGVSERPDALRTRAALLRDPFVRALARARRVTVPGDGPVGARLEPSASLTAPEDAGEQLVLTAALKLIDQVAASDTILP